MTNNDNWREREEYKLLIKTHPYLKDLCFQDLENLLSNLNNFVYYELREENLEK